MPIWPRKPHLPRSEPTLSYAEAREFYDWMGAGQDSQAFYEDVATEDLVAHARFEEAESVLEFGCGTGRFAKGMLEQHLPPTAHYLGLDLSPEMVDLARERLEPFGDRASVRLTDGEPRIDLPDASRDRFVSNYVFDLLSEADCAAVVAEAARILTPGGLLCLVSLTAGHTRVSRVVERVWCALHARRPALVGGCRPIELLQFLPESDWGIRYRRQLAPFGVPSEVVVAAPR
jgi:ubiquinone/menaquinone biosynthesis C-methylase UbiE